MRSFSTVNYRVILAVTDIAAANALQQDGFHVVQAPVWPTKLTSNHAWRLPTGSTTIGDTIAGLGLGDPQMLQAVLGAWRNLLELINPDLIIADYSPGVTLAARGRFPLALIGVGFCLPPAEMAQFPPLHQLAPQLWDEISLVSTINSQLGAHASPLQRYPQIFEADARLVWSFPSLDPYSSLRSDTGTCPVLDTLPEMQEPDADSILIYWSRAVNLPDRFFDILLQIAPRLRGPVPGFSSARIAELNAKGANLSSEFVDINEELPLARLILHSGGNLTTSLALLAGVPQVILSQDIEKQLTGEAVEKLGVGKLFKAHDPNVTVTAEMILAASDDENMAATARQQAHIHRQLVSDQPLETFVQDCLRLMGD